MKTRLGGGLHIFVSDWLLWGVFLPRNILYGQVSLSARVEVKIKGGIAGEVERCFIPREKELVSLSTGLHIKASFFIIFYSLPLFAQ